MHVFGFSAEVQVPVVSLFKINLVTIGSVAGVLVITVALLVLETTSSSRPRLGSIIATFSTFGGQKRGIEQRETKQIDRMRYSSGDIGAAKARGVSIRSRHRSQGRQGPRAAVGP